MKFKRRAFKNSFRFLLFTFTFLMWVANKRPRSRNYSVDQKWAKSGVKVANALKHFNKLTARLSLEGETKWLANAQVFVRAKLKKYGIKVS